LLSGDDGTELAIGCLTGIDSGRWLARDRH
jgi:hypothetical protein